MMPNSSTNWGNLFLVRHGQTDYNLNKRLQGQVDIPLNATGIKQAQALADLLSKLPVDQQPKMVVSSNLMRARTTGEIIAEKLQISLDIDSDLIERSFGDWEGLTREEISDGWPEASDNTKDVQELINAEDRHVVAERYAAACMKALDQAQGQHALVVSHGAATRIGMTYLLGLDPSTFLGLQGLHNCHYSIMQRLQRADNSGRKYPLMRLLSHNQGADFS